MPTVPGRPFTAALFATALLAACGGGGGSGGDHANHETAERLVTPVEGASEIAVTAVDVDYEPGSLQLRAGDPVNITITNTGEAEHDFTLEEADVHVNLPAGESKTTGVTIPEAGSYQALCTVAGHAEAGMTIDITVD